MMFGQVLRLIGAATFVFSTFIFCATALKCDYGGVCYLEDVLIDDPTFKTKTCFDSCVYFKCFVGDYKIMEGAGCFEEFVNTCKYVDPQLLKEIKSSYQDYSIYNRSLILTSCNHRDGCAKEMFEKMIAKKFLEDARLSCKYTYLNLTTDECVKKEYDEKIRAGHRLLTGDFRFRPMFERYRPKNGTCEYDNTPKQKLSQVKCETIGLCKAGGRFKYYDLDIRKTTYSYKTKTCDACSKFLCTFDGKEIISGHGCFEDFERMCGVVINETIKNELSANRKDYFYYNANILMVTCSDSDDCQFNAFRKYYDINFGSLHDPPLLRLRHSEICDYKPIVIPPTTTTMTTTESPTTTTKTSSTISTTPLVTTTSTKSTTTKTSSSSSTTTTAAVSATTELVPFESTRQQKEEEEKDNKNSAVLIYASFYLMFLIIVFAFL